MAGKSQIQTLIEQYEAAIAEHKRQIATKKEFLESLYATKKAKARVKPRKPAETPTAPRAVNE